MGEQESCGMLCTVKNVSEVKCLLTLIPMWANFSAYCLIAATGDTFFVEQSNNLKKADYLSLSVLFFLRSFICLAIKLPFGWEKVRQKCGLLMRIGAGMVCSIACCIVAWQVEVHRMNLTKEMRIDHQVLRPEGSEDSEQTIHECLHLTSTISFVRINGRTCGRWAWGICN